MEPAPQTLKDLNHGPCELHEARLPEAPTTKVFLNHSGLWVTHTWGLTSYNFPGNPGQKSLSFFFSFQAKKLEPVLTPPFSLLPTPPCSPRLTIGVIPMSCPHLLPLGYHTPPGLAPSLFKDLPACGLTKTHESSQKLVNAPPLGSLIVQGVIAPLSETPADSPPDPFCTLSLMLWTQASFHLHKNILTCPQTSTKSFLFQKPHPPWA